MLERGGVSCSHHFSCFTFMVDDDYLVNYKVVSKTTKCRDFTVISHIFSKKLHSNFADFFTVIFIFLQPYIYRTGIALCTNKSKLESYQKSKKHVWSQE